MLRTAGLVMIIAGSIVLSVGPPTGAPSAAVPTQSAASLFEASDVCLSCHNEILTPSGEDISFGSHWRTSMMANSARDPYWHAAVRRETLDHPRARAAIEDECSACHMPMATYESRAQGTMGVVFAHLAAPAAGPAARLALDGASCTTCHQITNEGFGERRSFNARFRVADAAADPRPIYGPYAVDAGRRRVMQSASTFAPGEATHLQESALCATCHTLFTHAFGPDGAVVGELPEQVPYLEWEHSAYRHSRSCQSCHMPRVQERTPVTSVLGQPRDDVARHLFVGGNFFMMRLLRLHAADLGVPAPTAELDLAERRTVDHLQAEAATLSIASAVIDRNGLTADVVVGNLAGHKVPTAYPSRRAWIHFTVRDAAGEVVFESGRLGTDGRIAGNANDDDGATFEPHHTEITAPDQVQIYEAVMVDAAGVVTTGLLSGVRYVKDNRLPPKGFDKLTATEDVAVHGEALSDEDFGAGGDRLRYVVALGSRRGPFHVDAEIRYQPIGFRWADNLRSYPAAETDRFVAYYEALAPASTVTLARAGATVP
jgi:hypothetical protein